MNDNADGMADSRATRTTRRHAVQALAATAGGLLLIRAGLMVTRSHDEESDDGHDGSGHGRGRGGDDDRSGRDGGDKDEVPQAADTQAIGPNVVRIVSDDAGGFVPAELTVDAGASVTFRNEHSDDHTATGSGFDTGIIPSGSSATVRLDVPGRFAYACQIHPVMTGVISVRGADGRVPAAATRATPEGSQRVSIANLAYAPTSLTVQTGQTVVWENDDTVPHTVTSLDGTFDSGIFDPGSRFSWRFERPGAVDYRCQLHPQMRGTIVVEGDPISGATPVASPTARPESAEAQSASPSDDAVSIVDFSFDPPTIEISPGSTVRWQNSGQVPHTVTGDFADSGPLAPEATFTFTFAAAGEYPYSCSFHPNMTAVIVVS